MTREQAKSLIPIITAFANGGNVQVLSCTGKWVSEEYYTFDSPPNVYRIKPEPKLRAWKSAELPQVQILLRQSISRGLSWSWTVLAIQHDGLVIADNKSGVRGIYWDALLERYEHSTDNGVTWNPCGILEDAP